ncbi:Endonuclease/exonuclease/phosphatase, partial [Staphylotrichum tortipilum]
MASPPPLPTESSSITDAVDLSSTNPHSLHHAVHARRSQYLRRHRTRIKIGTWNVAACPGTDKDLARWFIDGEGLDPALGSARPSHNDGEEREGSGVGSPGGEAPIELATDDKIGLYVLGLQEVNVLTAPGQYMPWIYASDDAVAKWKAAMEAAVPDGYQLVAAEQLAGMLLLAYASPEIAPTISNVSAATVGAGALNYFGNKGAVCTRIVLGEATQLLFVNSHLASGVDDYYLGRRIDQAQQVVAQARFEPITVSGVSEDEKGRIGDEDFAFWFGDLNFRLDRLPGDDIRRLLMLHTRGEYDLSKRQLRRESSLDGEPIVVHRLSDSSDETPDESAVQGGDGTADDTQAADDDSLNIPDPDELPPDPHDDPASLQATLDSLLPHDQLGRSIKQRKVFHEGWREGPISFLPTYKYDVGTVSLFDSSEKRRPPSWCDRILYRTRKDFDEYERKAKEEEEARKKDEEMKARGLEEAGEDDEVLFSYDPENDGEELPTPPTDFSYDEYDDAEDAGDLAQQPDDDRIRLELYTSHQRITSSDHKPVSSIFSIDYDGVVPQMKAKVHAEVARELDRAENEGRPVITIVADHHDGRNAPKDRASAASTHVDFGDLRFLEKCTSSLTLANTGGVSATLSFVDKPTPDDAEAADSTGMGWLKTHFVHIEAPSDEIESVSLGREITLEPGDTVNVVLVALVDEVSGARMLNEGQTSLEEVLVLRVTDGRDHFIPVHATWLPTCIGRSVEELIRVPDGGIRAFAQSLAEKKGHLGAIPYDLAVHRPAPKELFQLTEAIETLTQRVLADSLMLEDFTIPSNPGWPFDETTCTSAPSSAPSSTRTAHIIALLDALDRDQPPQSAFAPETPSLGRLEATAQTLLLFLRGLTDGVIPTSLWNRIDQAAPSIPSLNATPSNTALDDPAHDDDRTTILDILQSAPHHNICFVFLTTTLARVVAELAPLSRTDLEILRTEAAATAAAAATPARGIFGVGRKSLSFVRRPAAPVAGAMEGLGKRRERERRVAGVFGGVVCRGLENIEGVRE